MVVNNIVVKNESTYIDSHASLNYEPPKEAVGVSSPRFLANKLSGDPAVYTSEDF